MTHLSGPRVSVVTATYNRSDVLAHAVRSVIAQTVTDWELLVVGDRCTDDTARVVAAFGDRRVRFVNRQVNHGEQSAPNNDGVALSRGRYLAFLNHDDLWYPWHLERGLNALQESGADLFYAPRATLGADRRVSVRGPGSIRDGRLCASIPASSWILRRELAARVGDWRSAFDLRCAPSQDWLMRALDAGATIVCGDTVTLIKVPSQLRPGSYLATDAGDVEAALALLDRDRLEGSAQPTSGGPAAAARRGLWRALEPLILAAGRHPFRWKFLLRGRFGRGRGAFMRRLRARRGLPPTPKGAIHG